MKKGERLTFSARMFTTQQPGKRLRVSQRRVRVLCETGRLGTLVLGRWLITDAELRAFKPNPPGRQKGWRKKQNHR